MNEDFGSISLLHCTRLRCTDQHKHTLLRSVESMEYIRVWPCMTTRLSISLKRSLSTLENVMQRLEIMTFLHKPGTKLPKPGQTDKQTDGQRDRQTEGWTDKQTTESTPLVHEPRVNNAGIYHG